MKYFSLLISIYLISSFTINAQTINSEEKNTFSIEKNIQYQKGNSYTNERCVLDVYYPNSKTDLPIIIFFHGGGLKRGEKYIPEYLKDKEIIVVSVNYRFYPNVKVREIINDAVVAVKWVYDNINKYGGNKNKIFLSGHSAGGYLVSMIGLDNTYLEGVGLNPDLIAGLIPLSGQVITHSTEREDKEISANQPIIDEMAPMFYAKKNTPPYIMITGDRNLELRGRYEENALMYRMMKLNGNENTELYELQGYGHMTVDAAIPIVFRRINEIIKTDTK